MIGPLKVPRPAGGPLPTRSVARSHPGGSARIAYLLPAVRVSRCVRQRIDEGARARVVGVQRRACQLTGEDGSLLMLSIPGVALAPNGIAVDAAPFPTLPDAGFHVGQVVALGPNDLAFGGADWRVAFDTASTWEPRPPVHRVDARDLADRLRATRATVVAEGAGESLLSLLWAATPDSTGFARVVVRAAAPSARFLLTAAE